MFRVARWIAAGFVVAASSVALVLIETGVWPDAPSWVVYSSAAALGFVAGIDFIAKALNTRSLENAEERGKKVRTALTVVFRLIEQKTSLEYHEIGLNCFLAPSWFQWLQRHIKYQPRTWLDRHWPKSLEKVRWLIPGGPKLQRVERFRLTGQPGESGIDWNRKKGLIGEAWQRNRDILVETASAYREYHDCDRRTWEEAPPEVTMGLKHWEFMRIQRKYGSVLVSPILDDRERFIGAVVLDTPADNPCFDELNDPQIKEWMGNAAQQIRGSL